MLRKRRLKRPLVGEQAADPTAALAAAVGWLSRRDFCSAELAERLTAQGFASDAVQGALSDLSERRYLDDARYAQQFVAYHAERGQGPLRIRRDLRGTGVAESQIEAALQQYADTHGDWTRLAREVRIRRFGLEAPSAWPQKAQQARFLQSRGFSTEDIRCVLGRDALGDAD